MKVLISYSHRDKSIADYVASRMVEAGHTVWYDAWRLRAGDNLFEKIKEGIREAEAIVILVSKHSLKSKWVQREISAMAIGDITKEDRLVVPIILDDSPIPDFISRYRCIILKDNTEEGVRMVLETLAREPSPKSDVEKETIETHAKLLSVVTQELRAGRLTLVCGAGISVGAGIPSWNNLLLLLLHSMMAKLSEKQLVPLKDLDARVPRSLG